MKSIASIVFILILCFTSCVKKAKYPKDIPQWLKDKIEKMDKETPREGVFKNVKQCAHNCREIKEYTDGSSTYYWIDEKGYSPQGYWIYNYNGDFQCLKESGQINACYSYSQGQTFVRQVWLEGGNGGN